MLKTEMRNPHTMHFDSMTSAEQVAAMCRENQNAVLAVEKATPEIAKAIDAVAAAFHGGHRLFFIGAGTSGRLGVLDAAECPPTFGVPHDMVQGIIAGGKERMFSASENDEDKFENGVADIKSSQLSAGDVLVGVSVAGGAAYVVAALEYANAVGAVSVSVSSNYDTPMEQVAKIAIITPTGPEVITGSTRMKSGTAQKLVLNMISTCAMIKTGKVYENMMINLKPSNQKLRARMINIVCEIKGCDKATAEALLEAHDWSIREAVE